MVPNQIGGEGSKVSYLCKHPAKRWAQWSGEYFQGEEGNSRSSMIGMISLFQLDQQEIRFLTLEKLEFKTFHPNSDLEEKNPL